MIKEEQNKITREIIDSAMEVHNTLGRRVDFLVENEISLEIKAVINLEDVHLAQAINYLEAYNLQTGLLINFGVKSLQYKRLFNKKYKVKS